MKWRTWTGTDRKEADFRSIEHRKFKPVLANLLLFPIPSMYGHMNQCVPECQPRPATDATQELTEHTRGEAKPHKRIHNYILLPYLLEVKKSPH